MFQDIEYNGIRGSSIKVFAKERPSIPAARKRREGITIPGRDGILSTTNEEYEPTEITIPFNYIGEEEQWAERWRVVQKWLSAENSTLRFSDDGEYFYRIDYVNLEENERTTARIGNFNAMFVTRDGLSYLVEGTRVHKKEEVEWNQYEMAKPLYKITGEGLCVLAVNGKEARVNVGQNVTIDTERMLSYRSDGKLVNTSLIGNYEDLYLAAGKNELEISKEFELEIIPNWRRL